MEKRSHKKLLIHLRRLLPFLFITIAVPDFLLTSETNIIAMRLGPGKHLEGRTLMGGIVKPEEFDYFFEVRHVNRGLTLLKFPRPSSILNLLE